MATWIHSRRGRIEGELLRQDNTWAHIRLTATAKSASLRARGHGPTYEVGEVITVRLAHLTEITIPTIPQLIDFAATHPLYRRSVDEDIRRDLRITPARYFQLLNRAIATEEAVQHDPVTVHRLRRQAENLQRIRADRLH